MIVLKKTRFCLFGAPPLQVCPFILQHPRPRGRKISHIDMYVHIHYTHTHVVSFVKNGGYVTVTLSTRALTADPCETTGPSIDTNSHRKIDQMRLITGFSLRQRRAAVSILSQEVAALEVGPLRCDSQDKKCKRSASAASSARGVTKPMTSSFGESTSALKPARNKSLSLTSD